MSLRTTILLIVSLFFSWLWFVEMIPTCLVSRRCRAACPCVRDIEWVPPSGDAVVPRRIRTTPRVHGVQRGRLDVGIVVAKSSWTSERKAHRLIGIRFIDEGIFDPAFRAFDAQIVLQVTPARLVGIDDCRRLDEPRSLANI